MAGKVTGLYLKGLDFWHKTWISVKLDVIHIIHKVTIKKETILINYEC